MSLECNNQITQALTIGKLPEHHCKELIPKSQVLDIFVAIVFANKIVEMIVIQNETNCEKTYFSLFMCDMFLMS